ncbi:unnamed protein product [Rotaria sp. Silwood2]|nr:unnamed protein product [Rotaria sp. Silwood2]CAF4559074.1 unnamed protein product [Rotaria sp. Silwood2]
MVYDKNSTSKAVRKESTINSTTAKAMNTVPKIQSSPKKHCFDDGNTSTKKRQKTRIEERSTTESHTSTSRSKNASLNKDVISTNKKLIWNDQWLTFNETPKLEEIKIDARSSLKWCSNFISKTEGDALFDHLMEILNFEHTLIRRYGKLVNMPRLQSWFADEGMVVRELFQKQKQHVWTPPMLKVKAQLEKQLDVKFDFCLVNLYRDGKDYIGFHTDNETRDTIASLTLGTTRRFNYS